MTPAARLSAAIELIDTIDAQRVPAAKALKEWGTAHRYAGSGDRAAIAGPDLGRAAPARLERLADGRRNAAGARARHAQARARLDAEAISALCDGGRFAPEPLSEAERAALTSRSLDDAPAHIAGDYPEWLDAHLADIFGDDRVAEATAMASRAPLDLRVNTLKAKPREDVAAACLISARSRRRGRRSACASNSAPMRAIPASMPRRISSRAPSRCRTRARSSRRCCPAAKPGEQVIDLCAGAGGKTLALAAMMQGKGRLIATDHDKRQLAPIHERLSRAGIHNADVRTPKGDADPLGRHPAPPPISSDRRALHRHRHVAPQPRRQMADAPRRARSALEGPGRSA